MYTVLFILATCLYEKYAYKDTILSVTIPIQSKLFLKQIALNAESFVKKYVHYLSRTFLEFVHLNDPANSFYDIREIN